ncbi:hypothetical protein LTS08_000558 [Lithohypha guttulata]|nr:hypothetical protein LTS08_000558 [Lithohypha guttulata]
MGIGASSPARFQPGLVVTLDALGTLYKFRQPLEKQYIKVAGRCGLRAPIKDEDLSSAFKKSFRAISTEYPNYGKGQLSSPRAWWKTVVNDAFRQVVDENEIPDHLGEELYDHFTSSAAYELYPDVHPFFASMRELKQRYPRSEDPIVLVGVVSNSDPRIKAILQSLGLRCGWASGPIPETTRERWNRTTNQNGVPDVGEAMKSPWYGAWSQSNEVDFIASSYDADAEKPDPDIFNHARMLCDLNIASRFEQEWKDWRPSLNYIKHKLKIQRRIEAVNENSTFIHIGDEYLKDYGGALYGGFEPLLLKRDGSGPVPPQKWDNVTGTDTSTVISDLEQAAVAIRIIADQHFTAEKSAPQNTNSTRKPRPSIPIDLGPASVSVLDDKDDEHVSAASYNEPVTQFPIMDATTTSKKDIVPPGNAAKVGPVGAEEVQLIDLSINNLQGDFVHDSNLSYVVPGESEPVILSDEEDVVARKMQRSTNKVVCWNDGGPPVRSQVRQQERRLRIMILQYREQKESIITPILSPSKPIEVALGKICEQDRSDHAMATKPDFVRNELLAAMIETSHDLVHDAEQPSPSFAEVVSGSRVPEAEAFPVLLRRKRKGRGKQSSYYDVTPELRYLR